MAIGNTDDVAHRVNTGCQYVYSVSEGAITSKIKHSIKLKTSPARLAPSFISILFQLAANDGALDGAPSLVAS